MTREERLGLIYLTACLGSGYFAYKKGKRGWELAGDALYYGALIGTGTGVVFYLADGVGISMLGNGESDGMGNMSKSAVDFIKQVDADALYADYHANGVTIAPVPQNHMMVSQEP